MQSINLIKELNLIVVPTLFEASFIKELINEKSTLLSNTGISLKTAKEIDSYINKNKLEIKNIILLGFAGVLKNNIKLNTPYSINECTYKEETLEIKILNSLNLETKSIVTVKKPIHSDIRKNYFKNIADLVDMETYFLNTYCTNNNINFYSIRVALDNCNTNLIDIFKHKVKTPKSIIEAGNILNKTYQTILQLF